MGSYIYLANAIIKSERIITGGLRVYYSLRKYKKKGYYDIMIYISEHVILVQLLDSLGNLNRAISVVGYWIFESNYERALVLNIKYLDMICAPSVGEEEVDTFGTVL